MKTSSLRRGTRAAVLAGAMGAGLLGCAELLGGLDDGVSRQPSGQADASPNEADSNPDTTGSSFSACDKPGWLTDFRHRIAFEVHNENALELTSFPVRLGFASRHLIEAEQMQVDGRDIRVAMNGGIVPHWIQSGIGGEATVVWARVDLAPGKNQVFLYYDNDRAPQTSSLRDTFIDGVLANGTFDNGTAPWIATPAPSGAPTVNSLSIEDRRATIQLGADGGAELRAGWCQLVTFPSGADVLAYRLIFDLTVRDVEQGEPIVIFGGLNGTVIWTGFGIVGPQRGLSTGPIDAGASGLICASARLVDHDSSRRIALEYSNLRVGAYAALEPIASPPADPEPCVVGVQRQDEERR